ncbi:LysR family transcriptional regulator [Psychrobacter pygoscelis]|uniref:LysR family transcriptional regulator n=1 Tax=Psychrobacter pygoscelis TaxID=2488563 RepID=UPI00103D80A7|nr:LysR family transcriptional regulator [Psychrobacter pygoscelis]
MQLKQIQAFHAVAKSQSFSAAATTTGLSQPTLSRLIKQLEEQIGAELVDRYHRPLQLTEAGMFYFEKSQLLLAELDTISALTKRMAHPPKTLSIGFVPSVLYGLLPDIIALLKQQLPDLEVQLKDISSYQQLDALKSGEIDVGFGRFAQQDEWVRQILLRHERYVVALPAVHPLAEVRNLRLPQLADNRLILYHQTHLNVADASLAGHSNIETEPLLNLFARYGAAPFSTTTVSDLQVALGLVAAGEGITLVPDSLKILRGQQIRYQSLLHEDATSPIYLNTLAQMTHPAFEHFLETIYQVYEHKGITYRRQSL